MVTRYRIGAVGRQGWMGSADPAVSSCKDVGDGGAGGGAGVAIQILPNAMKQAIAEKSSMSRDRLARGRLGCKCKRKETIVSHDCRQV